MKNIYYKKLQVYSFRRDAASNNSQSVELKKSTPKKMHGHRTVNWLSVAFISMHSSCKTTDLVSLEECLNNQIFNI